MAKIPAIVSRFLEAAMTTFRSSIFIHRSRRQIRIGRQIAEVFQARPGNITADGIAFGQRPIA
jgi:hypothetical protein